MQLVFPVVAAQLAALLAAGPLAGLVTVHLAGVLAHVLQLFMVIFEVKGIEAHSEETHNNECQSVYFVRLKCKKL